MNRTRPHPAGTRKETSPEQATPIENAVKPARGVSRWEGSTLLAGCSVALAVALVLPSARLWTERPFRLTAHEFDFFLGLFSGTPSATAGTLLLLGRVLHALLIVAAGIVFLRLARQTEADPSPEPDARLLRHAIILSVIFAVGLPWLSPDVFYYMGLGWLEARYDLDPFLHAIAFAPGFQTDEMFANVFPGLLGVAGTYGPLFQSLATGLAAASAGDVRLALVLFKFVGLATHVAASGLVTHLAPAHERRFAFFAFACNPLILLNALTGMHNDHLMILFLLLAVRFRRSSRPFASGAALGFAFCVKYAPVLLLPLFVVDQFLPRRPGSPRSLRGPALFLAGFGASLAAFALRYPSSVRSFLSAVERGSGTLRSSVHFVLSFVDAFVVPLPREAAKGTLLGLFLALALLSVALLVRDRLTGRSGALERSSVFLFVSYFLTLNTSNHEWYLTWLVGPALIGAGAAGRTLALRLSAFFMPLVIFSVHSPAPITWAANAALYLLLLSVSVPFLIAAARREPSPAPGPP